ncbi:hypothetical protein [Massilia oculi]|uniref:hypothetical protein n=1 Tax=Massilia oculi TaxID=945844 RepID=UPI001AAF216D|nr:hypothetical protein [Massilia oculi]
MANAASTGSSVEGEKMDLATRQFFALPPRRCKRTKKMQYPFSLSIFGSAEISEAYEEPEIQAHLSTSMVAIGDKVHGTSVSGWASKLLKEPYVTKTTHTHSASVLSVKGGCFAQVDAPPREHLESADIQKRNPAVQQIENPLLRLPEK